MTSTRQSNYTHVADANSISLFGGIQLPIFDRNQGEIARTRYAIGQSQELLSEQNSLALTDVENSYESLRTDDEVVQLYQSGYLQEAEESKNISQYAYQRGAASLLDFLDAERSYRATELSLQAGARRLHDLTRAIAPSRGYQELAMKIKRTCSARKTRTPTRAISGGVLAVPLFMALAMAGCGSSAEQASKMTSFSTAESAQSKAELFTLPADQMSHIQIFTVTQASVGAHAAHFWSSRLQRAF